MARTKGPIYDQILDWSSTGQKGLGWLIDPDKFDPSILSILKTKNNDLSALDFILVGGSQMDAEVFQYSLRLIKEAAQNIPLIIFPGSNAQLSEDAEAILFLSLLSGRNPRFLVEEQVQAARRVDGFDLEVIPTAYILVNDGHIGSVHHASGTLPIPNSDIQKCVDTALAGKFMGMKLTYLDAGSGLDSTVSPRVVEAIKDKVKSPIIVGGGIDSLDKLKSAYTAGADLVVIGNAIEKDPNFLVEVLKYKELRNFSSHVN